jgi:dephospho-CoA kinase
MIRIGILGKIGSGKSYVAGNFGFPVFNADNEVAKIYKKNKKIFIKLNKILPKYIHSFPINKNEIIDAILSNKNNLKKIITIVHKEIRKKMKLFLKKNKNKKAIILDIPLLLENKLYDKNDILIFIDSRKIDIEKRLKKRSGYNRELINNFENLQLSAQYKKKKSHFIIKNNFTKKTIKVDIKNILNKIL